MGEEIKSGEGAERTRCWSQIVSRRERQKDKIGRMRSKTLMSDLIVDKSNRYIAYKCTSQGCAPSRAYAVTAKIFNMEEVR